MVPGNQGKSSVLLLETQEKHGFAYVSTQDEALDAGELVCVYLRVYECHAHQVSVLELPDVNLPNGRHQQATAEGYGGDRPLLLPLVQHLEAILSTWLARLWHHIYHVKDQDTATARDVLSKAVRKRFL